MPPIIDILEHRFRQNEDRHRVKDWEKVVSRLLSDKGKLSTLERMEDTGGEPDLLLADDGQYVYCDFSKESPIGRRSLCYDLAAWTSRKENKPKGDAMSLAAQIGAELMDELMYRKLLSVGEFDTKTSSWIITPEDIRARGGALFGDYRYGHVFVYHNGAESYYAARGFRCIVRV